MADVLSTPCVGRIAPINSACGCTLTRTTITGLSPTDIVALSNKEIALTRAILDGAEARMLGVPENPLMMILNGRIKDVKDQLGTQKIGRQSIVMPFLQRPQRSFINANYFQITAGTPTPGAGSGTIPPSAFNLTVGLGASPFQSALQNIQRYFVPGQTLIVQTWDGVTTQNAQVTVFTIISAVEADVGAVPYAVVTVYPPVSNANWTGVYTTAQKKVYQPTFGLVTLGANSIANEESYCNNQPSDINKNLIVNWLQTSRESYCREQQYEEVLDAIMKGKVNDYLKGFVYESVEDQQKQMKMAYEREWYNSVFYGQAIDVDNQTIANWQQLPVVYDIVNTSCPLAYKASAFGIFTLLNQCNRVVDLMGMPLDLNYIFGQLYYLRRNRNATGDRVDVIDSMTDRFNKGRIFETMCKYYTVRFGLQTTRYFKANEKITHDGILMFDYDMYDIEEASATWAVFNIDYFNDLKDAANVQVVGWNFSARMNNLWFIDWSDVDIGVGNTMQVTRKSPDPATDVRYKCVITPNVSTYDLRSKLWTVMVDRPQRHLIIHNFASVCPNVTIPGCAVPQS